MCRTKVDLAGTCVIIIVHHHCLPTFYILYQSPLRPSPDVWKMWKLLKISEGPPCMTAYRYILDFSIYLYFYTHSTPHLNNCTDRFYNQKIYRTHSLESQNQKKTFLFITGQLSNHKINVGTCRKHCWFVVFLSVSNNLYFNFKATKSQKRIRNCKNSFVHIFCKYWDILYFTSAFDCTHTDGDMIYGLVKNYRVRYI